jgi:glycosyltransferase involved in cell wall biosynthesis
MANNQKKLVVGITAAGSVGLLPGQLQYFKDKGYKTYLLAPRTARSEAYCEKEGCELLAVDLKREISLVHDFKCLLHIFFIFLKLRPDIVNLGTPKVSLLGMIAAKLTGVKKRIYTCRGLRYEHEQGKLRKILILMERITASCAHNVNCISDSVKNLGIRDKIFKESNTIVIHKGSSNGIDLSCFDFSSVTEEEKNELRKLLNLEGYFVYGFLGRIIDRKGVQELYEAFDILYRENRYIRLLIVGPVEMSQLKNPKIIDLIKNHEGIIWPGRTDDVPLHLAIMDVFVLPAWWEGFGNVLVQAAAMGVPVISTTGTGTIDAVSDGYNGTLVPVKDVESLKIAMEKLLIDHELRANYGRNGMEWAKNFDNKIIWEGLEKLYSD